jgi:pyrrolidone-carboxylate peptidase
MNKTRPILVYGFGPYRQFKQNITARIVTCLPRRAWLKKIVFPVRFHRRQFVEALDRFKPDVVLGLGQSSRRKIEVESRAVNRKRVGRRAKLRPIMSRGERFLKTTLEPKLGRQARRSANAGDYVCNFSMYVMLDHILRNRAKIPYGFIHIPHDYDPVKARRLVERALRRLR